MTLKWQLIKGVYCAQGWKFSLIWLEAWGSWGCSQACAFPSRELLMVCKSMLFFAFFFFFFSSRQGRVWLIFQKCCCNAMLIDSTDMHRSREEDRKTIYSSVLAGTAVGKNTLEMIKNPLKLQYVRFWYYLTKGSQNPTMKLESSVREKLFLHRY